MTLVSDIRRESDSHAVDGLGTAWKMRRELRSRSIVVADGRIAQGKQTVTKRRQRLSAIGHQTHILQAG